MHTHEPPLCAPADPSPRPASFTPPAGACDCHAHVFAPASRLVPERVYTPPPAPFAGYRRVLATLGIDRAVIVQPSVYGSDNRATLAAVAAGGDAFRAVVVVDQSTSRHALRDMHERGARGARINAMYAGAHSLHDLPGLAHILADLGWHLQLLMDVSQLDDLANLFRDLPVPVVFDHMGHVPAARGTGDPGFQALLRLMAEGRAWAKLSGSYRTTAESHPPYGDVAPFARALVAANPDQCVWASDWPHPHIPVTMPNDGALLDMLQDWVPDPDARNRILVDNPARLYGFGA